MSHRSIAFVSWEEVQQSLLLLPRVEEEGRGAVVAAHLQSTESDSLEGFIVCELQQQPASSSTTQKDVAVDGAVVVEATTEPLENDAAPSSTVQLYDMMLSDIMSTLRTAAPPIVLLLEAPPPAAKDQEEIQRACNTTITAPSAAPAVTTTTRSISTASSMAQALVSSMSKGLTISAARFEEEKKCTDSDHTQGETIAHGEASNDENSITETAVIAPPDATELTATATTASTKVPTREDTTETRSDTVNGTFASWTQRMRQQATEAAASMAAATTAGAKERIRSQQQQQQRLPADKQPSPANPDAAAPPPQLFIQSKAGYFMLLRPSDPAAAPVNGDDEVTTACLLAARRTPAHACPPDYRFQWYRSYLPNDRTQWQELCHATYAAFQPSVLDIGHCLQCRVYDNNYADMACLTTPVVHAASTLFHGTLQALARSAAHFGGIMGHGPAHGRHFCVSIHNVGTLQIYQVVGKTTEPLCPVPLRFVAARIPDFAKPKHVELLLPPDAPALLQALAVPDATTLTDSDEMAAPTMALQIEVANRTARESLIMALGLAYHSSQPEAMTVTTPLFDSPVPLRAMDDPVPSLADVLPGDDSENDAQLASAAGPSDQEQAANPLLDVPDASSGPSRPIPAASPSSQSSNRPASPLRPPRHHRPSTSDSMALKLSPTALMNPESEYAFIELQNEFQQLLEKLARKDKVVSELQRQLAFSDTSVRQMEVRAEQAEGQVQKGQAFLKLSEATIRDLQLQIQQQQTDFDKLNVDCGARILSMKDELASKMVKIMELEKNARTLHNEKAVLSAAVEAREGKLGKMAYLESSLAEAREKAADIGAVRKQLEASESESTRLKAVLQEKEMSMAELQTELDRAHESDAAALNKLQIIEQRYKSRQSEFDAQQMIMQKLKAERNSYKQKGDSLSKEIAKVCRNGRTIKDAEKILADDASRREEVALLRTQKQKALEELERYRTAYEQSRTAQKMAGLDFDAAKLLERNTELERVLSELTEYVTAKEMQLDTYRQVNDALQLEIQNLHKAKMGEWEENAV